MSFSGRDDEAHTIRSSLPAVPLSPSTRKHSVFLHPRVPVPPSAEVAVTKHGRNLYNPHTVKRVAGTGLHLSDEGEKPSQSEKPCFIASDSSQQRSVTLASMETSCTMKGQPQARRASWIIRKRSGRAMTVDTDLSFSEMASNGSSTPVSTACGSCGANGGSSSSSSPSGSSLPQKSRRPSKLVPLEEHPSPPSEKVVMELNLTVAPKQVTLESLDGCFDSSEDRKLTSEELDAQFDQMISIMEVHPSCFSPTDEDPSNLVPLQEAWEAVLFDSEEDFLPAFSKEVLAAQNRRSREVATTTVAVGRQTNRAKSMALSLQRTREAVACLRRRTVDGDLQINDPNLISGPNRKEFSDAPTNSCHESPLE